MTTRVIVIEWRNPQNATEAKFYGSTNTSENVVKVFINLKKNQISQDLTDTFFHEMAHVFFAFHYKNKKMGGNLEESIARKIGRICSEVLQ